jgi:hypothetical protein
MAVSKVSFSHSAGRFKAIDDEEALAAGEAVSVDGKIHYTTEHYHCHVCQKERKKEESSLSSDGRKCGPCRVPKAR